MRSCFAAVMILFFLIPVFAQKDGTSEAVTNGQLWNELNLTHAYHRVVLQADLMASHSNDTADQYKIGKHFINCGARAWAHYYITPRIKLSGMLSYQKNIATPEIYQLPTAEVQQSAMGQHFIVNKRITFYNRLRFDNRFFENTQTNTFDYAARLRYMPKIVLALNSVVIRKKSLYLLASDEIFMPFGKGSFINMNMANLGLGYCFTGDIILELCYTHQYKVLANSSTEITNAVGFTLSFNNFISMLK